MRPSLIAIAVGLVIPACSDKKQDPAPRAAPTTERAVAAPVKRPLDTRPLPSLATDPGGATGKPLWTTSFGGLGIDAARDVAIDATGAAYVVGYFDAEIDLGRSGKHKPAGDKKTSDAYVVKLGPDGKLAWGTTFGAMRDDTANAVAVRGNTVLVVGNFLDEIKLGEFSHPGYGSDDGYVAAFNKDGVPQWLTTFGGVDSDGLNTVASAPDGGWIVGGSFSDSVIFGSTTLKSRGGTDAMLMKLDAAGDLEWVKQFGGRYNDTILHVAVDRQGAIYVQGQFRDKAEWGGAALTAAGGSDNDVVLAKYDANGDHVWSKRFGNQFNDVAGGVTVDPAGNITMVGSFDKSISFGEGSDFTSNGESDIFVARLAPDGKLVWARTYGAEREDIAVGVASDAAGNVVVTGWFQGMVDFGKGPLTSKGNKDVFAIKLDAKGGIVWSQAWGDHDHDQGRAVAIDDKGAAIIVGIYRFTLALASPPLESMRAEGDRVPKPDTFVVKLDR